MKFKESCKPSIDLDFIGNLYAGHSKFLNFWPERGVDLSARSTYKQVCAIVSEHFEGF